MKKLVVFGAGKSATCLIDYLAAAAARYDWSMTVADGDTHTVTEKTKAWPHVKPVALNVTDGALRQLLVQEADIVISLLPPSLHFLLAQDCLQFGKHLLTASYTDDAIRALAPAIREKGLLFLCEMGLDPGIDHMSALEMIRRIQADGGHIKSFSSHCGGLVAPESDNNPWHYKISWNPRNVVMAGKAGAQFRQDGKTAALDYKSLFQSNRTVNIPGLGPLAYYPNRDSLGYIPLYGLESADDFIRTTLRYPGFCSGWKHIVDLQLTDETIVYDTDGMSLQQFFSQHFDRFKLGAAYDKLISTEPLFRVQMEYLGTGDAYTLINRGRAAAVDVLQFAIEKKWALSPGDKDMIVMLHEIVFEKNSKYYNSRSCLIVNGDDHMRTAMAKTVGLPLGIAASLLLRGIIRETGLHIPIIPSIYEPVLKELAEQGISFAETTSRTA